MFRTSVSLLAACAALGFGGAAVAGQAGASPGERPAAEAAAKKRGCATKKTKKARAQCQKLRKTGKYRKGQVCALAKQSEYSRYGFFCLDISARQDGSLTYLEDL